MRIAYITAHAPYGRGETFVLHEMLIMLAEFGVDLIIVPRNPPKEVYHNEAYKIIDRTIWLPLLNRKILLHFVKYILLSTRLWWILLMVFLHSRTAKILVKNLAVIPKAVFVAALFKEQKVVHIHAHWGSTTSTMAWVISELAGIPWSFTLHRWDIAENNMLNLKIERASFVRCISQQGREEVLKIVGEKYSSKVKMLHLGVRVPDRLSSNLCTERTEFIIVCPANLVPVKGHRFLIEACALLRERGLRGFQCLIIGGGPLKEELQKQIEQASLTGIVRLIGHLPHEKLLAMYEHGEVDVVVLPSIVTEKGEKEGIPVALMEAMAYGIPVISTNTGGIPELLGDGAGIIVQEKDSRQLADAIESLIRNKELAKHIGTKGAHKVKDDFNLRKNTAKLLQLIKDFVNK